MVIADWHDIENNVASEVPVKRFKSRKLESSHCRKHASFLAQMVPGYKKVTHNVTPHATRESRWSTRRRVPSRRAQGKTLCKKKAEFQTFLKLIATLWKLYTDTHSHAFLLPDAHVMHSAHFSTRSEESASCLRGRLTRAVHWRRTITAWYFSKRSQGRRSQNGKPHPPMYGAIMARAWGR